MSDMLQLVVLRRNGLLATIDDKLKHIGQIGNRK
jgi:hypothetical protein